MSTGIAQDDINLEETIKLYVNHRPVSSLNSNEIEAAFEIIGQRYSYSILSFILILFIYLLIYFFINNRLHSSSSNKASVRWADLKNLLMSEGEALAPRDLEECLSILMGENKFNNDAENTVDVTALSFAAKILGFEDFNT